MLSIIIPHRVDEFLNKTVTDLLQKARGEIEIIVICDGVWPSQIIDDQRVRYIHQGTVHNAPGMREAINKGMRLARGQYVMKLDEHCMLSEGFDLELIANCDDSLVIPRRKRLDAEKWELIEDGRPDIDYMKIDYPFAIPFDSTQGLHGAEWRERGAERKDILIDEVMTGQGSCYFLPKKLWDEVVGELETEKYGPFTMECQEVMNKIWLSGYKCLVNKNCWYAHYHKGKKGKSYGFSSKQYEVFMAAKEKGRQYAIDYWLTTHDYKYDFEWLVDKFSPIPGWPQDWKEKIEADKLKDFRYSPEFSTWKAH